MTPLLEGAQVEVKEYEKIVKSASKEYQDARAACEEQQKEIDKLTEPLERLEQEAHNEFDKVRFVVSIGMHLFCR